MLLLLLFYMFELACYQIKMFCKMKNNTEVQSAFINTIKFLSETYVEDLFCIPRGYIFVVNYLKLKLETCVTEEDMSEWMNCRSVRQG